MRAVRTAAACCVALAFLAGVTGTGDNKLPEDFIRCGANWAASELNSCLKRAVPDALRRMAHGLPSLGVAPMEPLAVGKVDVEAGAGPVLITQNYKKVYLHGLTASTITSYKADLKRHRLRTESLTPNLQFVGDYVMKGRILLLPIEGAGRANVTLEDLAVSHDLVGSTSTRDGKVYMHLDKYRVTFKPRRVRMDFTGLFGGNPALGKQMNMFLNDNADLVFGELRTEYERVLGKVFKDLANSIFDKVPLDEIFPPELPPTH